MFVYLVSLCMHVECGGQRAVCRSLFPPPTTETPRSSSGFQALAVLPVLSRVLQRRCVCHICCWLVCLFNIIWRLAPSFSPSGCSEKSIPARAPHLVAAPWGLMQWGKDSCLCPLVTVTLAVVGWAEVPFYTAEYPSVIHLLFSGSKWAKATVTRHHTWDQGLRWLH